MVIHTDMSVIIIVSIDWSRNSDVVVCESNDHQCYCEVHWLALSLTVYPLQGMALDSISN